MQVNFGAMDTGAAGITGAARAIEQKLADLRQFLQPLIAEWEGDASAAYEAKQRQWDEAAAGLFQILNQVGLSVGTAGENYQSAEKANTALWG
jgi:6 kDa early secretory antigenic target